MSVYTTLTHQELSEFLQTFAVGELTDFQGITEGIENTNYFVDAKLNGKARRFVLTIFESLEIDELPYFLELTAFLSEHDLPCAHPIANRQGHYLQTLKSKPAALVQRLDGKSINKPTVDHCQQVGQILGRMHSEGLKFSMQRENPRGYIWASDTAEKVKSHLTAAEQKLLEREIAFQSRHQALELPSGVIHADLFRDNVLFHDNKLRGVIDFYYACDGFLVYDLAITLNDWCSMPDGSLDVSLADTLLQSYLKARPLDSKERTHWPVMLRAAALRFWLSRLYDLHFPRHGALTHTHDPNVYRDILQNRINTQHKLPNS